MENKKFGTLLLLVGVAILALQIIGVNVISWPLIMIGGGVLLFLFLFKSTKVIILPSSIIVFLGIFFYIHELLGWGLMNILWPFFPAIIGASFFVTYLTTRKKGFSIVAYILFGVFGLLMLINLTTNLKSYILPLVIIGIGIFFFLYGKKDDKNIQDDNEEEEDF